MTPDRAAAIALDGIAFLAGRPEWLESFMFASGLGVDDLRTRIGDAGVQQAALGFLLGDDTLLLDFCRERELAPRDIHLARHLLETT
jgi:hypothetical protein